MPKLEVLILGRVFEYFLGEFALAEGKQGGQFYAPKSVVELLCDYKTVFGSINKTDFSKYVSSFA